MPGSKFKQKKGFTLMEIIVVLAIFSILSTIAADVYMMALRAQRQAGKRQEASSSLRFIMESMARQVRVSEINYAAYANSIVNSPESRLALRDQDGRTIEYAWENAGGGKGKMTLEINDNGVIMDLTDPDTINVIKFLFYISPPTNPFVGEQCAGTPGNNGCFTAAISCTVTDPAAPKNGFCCCTQNSNCASNNCDLSPNSDKLYKICEPGMSGGVCLPFNRQPEVTMILGFQSVGTKPEEQKTIYLQTTASSRTYKR